MFLAQEGALERREYREGDHTELWGLCCAQRRSAPYPAPGRGGFGTAILKRSPTSKKTPQHPLRPRTALTVSVVSGSQVGRGAAIHDGVGCQVCEEGQSPHQPRSICRREHVVRSCQPRAPLAMSWGLQPTQPTLLKAPKD